MRIADLPEDMQQGLEKEMEVFKADVYKDIERFFIEHNLVDEYELFKKYEYIEEFRRLVIPFLDYLNSRMIAQDINIDVQGIVTEFMERHDAHYKASAIDSSESPYKNLPSTALTNILKQFINNPTRIESPRRGQIQKEEHYLTHDTIITYKGKDGEYTISVERVKELFAKRVQNGTKIFNFLLQKLNDQNYQENTDFLLPELVEAGIYASPDSAYRGLKTVCDKFHHIGIAGVVVSYQGRKRKEIGSHKAALISEWTVTYNKCRVVLPQIIRNSAPYITVLPNWSYALPGENAYMLLDYIYYLARQNTDKIRERGYFTIKLDTIRQHLGLPSPKETARHNQFIVEPIEAAITAIEDGQQGEDLKITPMYNPDYKSIHEYLDGYLEIRLSGAAFEYMEKRAINQEKERKAARSRLEKAEQKKLKAGNV